MTEPKVTSITVHYHGGGKVALEEYGKLSADYGTSVSRVYDIPPDWSEDDVRVFELSRMIELRSNIDPLLQEDYENLMKQRKF